MKDNKRRVLLIFLLIVLYILIIFGIKHFTWPKIDITDNKIYTLTDASKQAVRNINDEIKIYLYGYTEDSNVVNLIKQYMEANSHISYEIITTATNKAKIAEYDLEEGYSIVIIEANGNHKLIDGNHQFTEIDYVTRQEIDITEQTITNAILSLTVDTKPVIYFTQGHQEYEMDLLQIIRKYLENEIYEVKTIDLAEKDSIPADCSILSIMTPTSDFTEKETELIKSYINNGGDIIYFKDVESTDKSYPNLQSILDLYGIKMINSVILEKEGQNQYSSDYPNIIFPNLSDSHEITKSIYNSKGSVLMIYAGKIEIASNKELEKLGVESKPFLSSSESSVLVKDLVNLSTDSIEENKSQVIGTEMIKKVKTETGEEKESKLIAVANNYFILDSIEQAISQIYPLSYMGNNKDIFLNAVAYLNKRDDFVTIRKDTYTTIYASNEIQNSYVKIFVFGLPIVIMITGFVVCLRRKNR